MSKPQTTLAIVGAGPRGLVALERLALCLDRLVHVDAPRVLVFERCDFPGAGPNYQPTQAVTNQLNIPIRSLPFEHGPSLNGRMSLAPAYRCWQAARVG